ncbi:hypothetical protein FJZ36_14365 [Candidatus Poribacteria bacterium]|nr:hypothetical protein [Candidatus Poribacteria bacterium]
MHLMCREVKARLDAYATGALPGSERLRLLAHLNSCPTCRLTLHAAERTAALVRRVSVAVPPPGYLESLPSKLDAMAPRALALSRLRRLTGAAVVAAVALLIVSAGVRRIAVDADHRAIPFGLGAVAATPALPDSAARPISGRDAHRELVASRSGRPHAARLVEVSLMDGLSHPLVADVEPVANRDVVASEPPPALVAQADGWLAMALPSAEPNAWDAGFETDAAVDGLVSRFSRPSRFGWRQPGDYGLSAFVRSPVALVSDVTFPDVAKPQGRR